MRRRTVGLALARGRGVSAWWSAAAAGEGARTEAFTFDADALAAGDDAALIPALRAAAQAALRGVPTSGSPDAPALHVALASPWTLPREVELPPMRESEARRVLQRDAARHFPVPRAEPVVAVRALRRGVWLACDADGVVLDTIARAARMAGFSAVRIMPAVGAWAYAVGETRASSLVLDGEAVVLGVQRGRIISLRRCRAADRPAADAVMGDALVLAACHAHQGTEQEFVSPAARAVRNTAVQRTVRALLRVGVTATVLAIAAQAWGGARRVVQLERQRAALQPVVAPLLALRDSLSALQDATAALSRGRAEAGWTDRLSALAETLPDGARLTALRGAGDSVLVEGTAPVAQAAVDALRSARGVSRVRVAVGGASTDTGESFTAIVFFRDGGAR